MQSAPRQTIDRPATRASERGVSRGTERTEERRLERPTNENFTNDGRFSIDLSRVPPGQVMEWKRHELMGMRDRKNLIDIVRFHWTPVPHKMMPHILGHLCQNEDEHILVDGLGLYMRPAYLNEEARAEDNARTNYTLDQQIKSLSGASRDQVGTGNTFFRKQQVPVSQPIE